MQKFGMALLLIALFGVVVTAITLVSKIRKHGKTSNNVACLLFSLIIAVSGFVLIGFASPKQSGVSSPQFFTQESVGFRLSAHRGAHLSAPENTLAAYNDAKKMGYGCIEVDPRITSDGKVVIMHDDTVDRTTNGTGPIANLSLSQVSKLNIDTKNYPKYQYKNLKVPTFDQVAKLVSGSKMVLNVDGSKVDWSNSRFTNGIVAILKKYNVYSQTYFVISNSSQRKSFNTRYPDATLSWLVPTDKDVPTAIKQAKSYKHVMLSVSADAATEKVLKQLQHNHLYFQVYGVNNPQRLRQLYRDKVPMVETDTLTPTTINK